MTACARVACALGAALATSACGGGDAGGLVVELRVPDDDTRTELGAATFYFVEATSAEGVVVASVGGPPGDLRLDDPPALRGLHLLFEARFNNDVIVRGRSCELDLTVEPRPTLSLQLTRPLHFVPITPPSVGRTEAGLVTLEDGRALLVGGRATSGEPTGALELYDVRSGAWTAGGTLTAPRAGPALALTAQGDVLVLGGVGSDGQPVGVVELVRIAGARTDVLGAPAEAARRGHRATALADGRVLVTGGEDATGQAALPQGFLLRDDGTVEAIDAGPLARSHHTATLAGSDPGDPVLLVGGLTDGAPTASIALFLPGTATVSPLGAATLLVPRFDHGATLLGDGKLLVLGGRDASGAALASAEIVDPLTREVRSTAAPLFAPRADPVVIGLADGTVLVAGGRGADGQPLDSAELYRPELDGFVPTARMATGRAEGAATPLCDGTIVLVGGTPAVEVYAPAL